MGPLLYLLKKFFLILWPCHRACGILVPRSGIQPSSPAVEVQSLNYWTTREKAQALFLITLQFLWIYLIFMARTHKVYLYLNLFHGLQLLSTDDLIQQGTFDSSHLLYLPINPPHPKLPVSVISPHTLIGVTLLFPHLPHPIPEVYQFCASLALKRISNPQSFLHH